ncbi:Lipoprotein LipO precursor [compost metagenome]
MKELERYTHTDIELIWVPASAYKDKTKIALSSLKLPTIMVIPAKSPEFISAVRRGMFWELGPYLDGYPNLKQANKTVLRNASVDGKIYSMYRARNQARYGVTIRMDWLENTGLGIPTTINEFYEVLRAFTYGDPDMDGRQDTYGLVATTHPSTFEVIQTWFGVPNQWGMDEASRQLVPAHLTKEYKEALKFFKRLYDEGLMNDDFAVRDPSFWREPLLHAEAGVLVDVADQAQRVAHDIEKKYGLKNVVDVFSGVEGPNGLRVPSNSGYDGMLAVSRSAVKTEQELRRVLHFLDKLNDENMQILLYNGIQGRHYQKSPEMTDVNVGYEINNLSQMLMFIPEARTIPSVVTPIRTKVQQVIRSNEPFLLNNPAEEFISDTYMKEGPMLDMLVSDARTQFILGQIDEEGWEKAIRQWRDSGGNRYIEEINDQFKQANGR